MTSTPGKIGPKGRETHDCEQQGITSTDLGGSKRGLDVSATLASGSSTVGTVDQGSHKTSGQGWRVTEYGTGGLPNFYTDLFAVVSLPSMVLVDPVALTALSIANGGALVTGDEAHDAADAGSPIKIGGKASTAVLTTPVANSDRTDGWFDEYGRLNTANWPKRPALQTFQSAVTLNNTTTSDNSSSFDCSPYRSGIVYITLTKAGGTAHSIDIFPQYSGDGGSNWHPLSVDHFVKMRFTAGQISSGIRRAFPLSNDYAIGRLFRIRVVGNTTTASNTITVTTSVGFQT